MNFILAALNMACCAWNVHDRWWGWATWCALQSFYFIGREIMTDFQKECDEKYEKSMKDSTLDA